MRRTGTIAFIALAAVTASSALGTAYYVSPSGSDANPGTAAQPFASFIPARNRSLPGDTTYFRQGTYANFPNEDGDAYMLINNRNGASGNPITFASYPGETATFDFQDYDAGMSFSSARHWKFHRLRFWTSTPTANRQGLTWMRDVEFDRCEFEALGSGTDGANAAAIFIGRGWGTYFLGNSVRNCWFHNLGGTSLACELYSTADMLFENNEVGPTPGGAFYDKDCGHRNIWRRNYMHDKPQGAGIQGNSGDGNDDPGTVTCTSNRHYENIVARCRSGITDPQGDQNLHSDYTYNNAIYQVQQGVGYQFNDSAPSTDQGYWNNIIHSASIVAFESRFGGPGVPDYCDYNCYYPNTMDFSCGHWGANERDYTSLAAWQAGEGLDSHSIGQDPLFVNAAANDFHLQAGSPCIHAGVNRLGLSPGYASGAPDIGAYPRGNDGTVIGILSAGTPTVRITTPSGTGTYTTTSSNVALGGTSSDPNGTVTQVAWTNMANGGHGTLTSGLANWSVSAIALAVGANVVRVTARDNDGNNVVDSITVNRTADPSDTTPAYVSDRAPAAGATGVALDQTISFRVRDDGAGVNRTTLVLRIEGVQVTPTVAGADADLTIVYNPPSDFAAAQVVDVALDVYDRASTPNRLQTTWSFTCVDPVQPDTTAPTVTDESPAPGATGVPVNSVVRFHVQDAGTGVDTGSIEVRVDGALVTPTSVDGTNPHDVVVTYNPDPDFAAATTFTIRVDADDLAATPNGVTETWSFTTGSIVVEPPPAPTQLVATPSTNYVVVTFAGSAGAAGYYLYHRNGTAGYVRTDIGGATYFILEGLQPGTLYHIRVTAYDVADQESDPTAEIAVTTLSAGGNGNGDEAPLLEELEIRPNRVSLSAGETVEIIGPPSTLSLKLV